MNETEFNATEEEIIERVYYEVNTTLIDFLSNHVGSKKLKKVLNNGNFEIHDFITSY